jgi:O-methyltransferase involved in polyketide biosynthesis
MKIELKNIEETSLLPLWSRAKVSREYSSWFNDTKAIELIEKIDYDFSILKKNFSQNQFMALFMVARAKEFDDKIRAFITEHPRASVINLGAGLDTTFYRVDNGLVQWYDLDLPDIMAIRKQLLPTTDRIKYISKSIFDSSWCNDIKDVENGVFIVACGVLAYFEDSQIKRLFSMLADNFPDSEVVFDASTKLGNIFSNWGLRRTGMKQAITRWALKDASKLTKWDKRIQVIDQFPYFNSIPRDPEWDVKIIRQMDFIERSRLFNMSNIFHLRV